MIGDFTRRVDVLHPIGCHQGATGTPFEPFLGFVLPVLPVLTAGPSKVGNKNTPGPEIHELVLRDCEDGRTTVQPQGLESEEYLNSTSQGELVLNLSKECPRTPGRTFKSTVGVVNS